MKLQKLLVVAMSTAFLAACGGGGGGSSAPIAPVTSTETFQVKTAYVSYFTDSRSLPFTMSGTTSGVSVNGSGTVTQSGVTSGTFEGVAALQKVMTITASLVGNGVTIPFGATSTSYVDSNYTPKGISGSEYSVVTSAVNIPVTAKVNDTGIWSTSNRYTTSAKTTLLGTTEASFVLQPDTASTALLKIIQTDKNTSGTPKMISTVSFRMTPAGALTRLSETGVGGTTNLTITY